MSVPIAPLITFDTPGSTRPGGQLRVLLITEGTYPHYWGGVSTWAHSLVWELDEVHFDVISITSDPVRLPLFELPANVKLRTIPLWGTREAHEGRLLANVPAGRWETARNGTVVESLLPNLRTLLDSLFTDEIETIDLAAAVHDLYRFLSRYHFDTAMRSRPVWETFTSTATQHYPAIAAEAGYPDAPLGLSDLTRGMQLVHRWLQPLAWPIPPTDVAHAAMAGICTLVAVAAKLDQKAGFVLTEHGIYLRERLLAESRSDGSLFLKLLNLRFALRMTELSYGLANRVAPCCDNHKRWELRLGAPPERVSTIYYGVDSVDGSVTPDRAARPPTVVWVGRIDPLKDIKTLLRAAARVHEGRPDIRFRLFGSAPPGNESYHQSCLELRADLGLEEVVDFAGFTNDTRGAFGQADLVVLSSISEGFPYSTLEAMVCSKPIVATGVGGLDEQVADCGIIVEPRNPDQMAEAILSLMGNPALLGDLGARARARATELFSLDRFRQDHLAVYLDAIGAVDRSPGIEPAEQLDRPRADPAFRLPPADTRNRNHRRSPAPRMSSRRSAPASPAVAWKDGDEGPPLTTNSSTALDDALEDLLEEVESRVPRPVDQLELTAVLESIGITDSVAIRYGARNTFELAVDVFQRLRARIASPDLSPHRPETGDRQPVRQFGGTVLLISLVPAVAVILSLQSLTAISAGHEAVALLFGVAAGMGLSNGLLYALTPRASLYVGCDAWALLQTLLIRFMIAGVVVVWFLAAAMLAALSYWEIGSSSERMYFIAGFVGLSIFWLMSASLLSTGLGHHVGAATLIGLVVGLAANAAGVSPVVQIGAGYLVALTLIAVDSRGVYRPRGTPTSLVSLPESRYLAREAISYLGFGLGSVALLLTPHLMAWYSTAVATDRLQAFWDLEVGLNLALVPLLAWMVLSDRTLRQSREVAIETQVSTPATQRSEFGAVLTAFYRRRVGTHLWLMTLLALIVYAAASYGFRRGRLAELLGVFDPLATEATLALSLVAYLMLGWSHCNCAFLFTLARPRAALATVATGLLAAGLAAYPLLTGLAGNGVAIVLLTGTIVFTLASTHVTKGALEEADYYYFAAT